MPAGGRVATSCFVYVRPWAETVSGMSNKDGRVVSPRVLFEDLDAVLFIEEIRKYPEIWAISSGANKDKQKKYAAWDRVCEKFCAHYGEKTEEEKRSIAQKYMNRWQNIRGQFQRSLRKRRRYNGNANRQYIYAPHLSFLEESERIETTTLTLEEDDEEEEEFDQKLISDEDDPLNTRFVTNIVEEPAIKLSRDSDTCLVNHLQSTVSAIVEEIDDDRSFFNSIIPMVRPFNMEQKIEFRCEILKLIKRIRSGSVSGGTLHTPSTPSSRPFTYPI